MLKMKNKLNKIQAEKIIEKSILALGLKEPKKTNPQIIKEIIREFKLDDFVTNNKVMQKFFHNSLTEPQDLKPMINCIKKSIVLKHPAIVEFLDCALNKQWLKPSNQIIKSLHVTYVLEALTATMCNDHDFFIEVHAHYKKKEAMLGFNTLHLFKTLINVLKTSPDFFEIAKPFSVDPFLVYFKLQRGLSKSQIRKDELKKLYKGNQINYIEYRLLSPIKNNHIQHLNELVRINIYEAGITEYKKGLNDNALCAHVLCEYLKKNPPKTIFKKKKVTPGIKNSFYNSISHKKNLFPIIKVSQNWTSLYTTWNMAFVLGNLDNLDIIFPKLFIPSIINAESENFLGVRLISLWLTINFVIFRKANKKEVMDSNNKVEMAKVWANINRKYAISLANNEVHENSKILDKYYNRFFSHPFWNLFKLIRNFD